MPYRRINSVVQHKVGGKWKKKAKAKNPASAKKMIRLLNAVKHSDWRPTKK